MIKAIVSHGFSNGTFSIGTKFIPTIGFGIGAPVVVLKTESTWLGGIDCIVIEDNPRIGGMH